MLTRHTEINAIFSCIRIPVRTGVVLETMECPKTAQLKAFWKIDFRLAKKISSQSRYDHFDTSPYMLTTVFRALFSIEKGFGKNWRKEQLKYSVFELYKTLILQGFQADKTTIFTENFESVPLWPLRYHSVYLSSHQPSKTPRKKERTDGEN